VKVFPTAGVTPSVPKNDADTRAAVIRSGGSTPDSSYSRLRNAAIESKNSARSANAT
jgi:hypothetical protein